MRRAYSGARLASGDEHDPVPGGGHVPIHDPLVPFLDVVLRFFEEKAGGR